MRNKKKILSKYKRKIIVDGREWTWRVDSLYYYICNPERTKKWQFGHGGYSPCDCSCHWEGNSDSYDWVDCFTCRDGCPRDHSMVTPSTIERTIKRLMS